MKRTRSASPCERSAALERLRERKNRAGQRHGLRDEERSELDGAEPGAAQVVADVLDAVLPWVQVEDELLLGVLGGMREEGGAGRGRSRWHGTRSSPRRGSGGT